MCIRDSVTIELKPGTGFTSVAGATVIRVSPVSYTHLDVYKRQVIFGVGCGLLTFLPDKYVFIWILSSIPFYSYLFYTKGGATKRQHSLNGGLLYVKT